ncbi:MAG TPA: hypothetical protein VFW93_04665 [Aquabacterium sp.]|uniref:hypothetical protein n=1 Tax=Aquabacterium sp. TaxID=1872578 RepID=UPI002E370F95|nr:hypothetical protein [Aquabacterium sp.]HEX5355482.1 hypothetical protein [Aquabacterium sp.]
MYDEDEDNELPISLLLSVPEDKRCTFKQLREMASLKGIEIDPSSTDDGLVGFRLEHKGESVRCPDLDSLKTELIAHGVPLLSDGELQELLKAFQSAFMRAMDSGGTAGSSHGNH